MVVVAVAGLGLLGTGVRGMAGVDARLSDAADRPAVRQIDVRQEIRAPDDCPSRERGDQSPVRDELEL
jgi:hypothetical protein